jgi:hypothetical protein
LLAGQVAPLTATDAVEPPLPVVLRVAPRVGLLVGGPHLAAILAAPDVVVEGAVVLMEVTVLMPQVTGLVLGLVVVVLP